MRGLLLDENVSYNLREELVRRLPAVKVYAVGDDDAPPKQTPDPDILVWIEEHECILLTHNRSTMPVHLSDHLMAGHRVPGIVVFSTQLSIGAVGDDLLLLFSAGLPG